MNRNTTLALVGVFGVLVLYLIFVQRPKEDAALNATPTAGPGGPVWSLTADQITALRIDHPATNENVAMQINAPGVWEVTVPLAQPADQTRITSALSQLAGLTFNATLTATADLSAFGLGEAAYALEVGLADGKTLTARIGNKTPTGSGYYFQRGGETAVLIVPTFGVEGVIGLVTAPPYFVPTPTVTPTVDLISTLLAPTSTPGALPSPTEEYDY